MSKYNPQVDDKITIAQFLHVIVISSIDDRTITVDGFRQGTEGECKPFEDEMTTAEVERLLRRKGGRIYRQDENGEYAIVLGDLPISYRLQK